MSQKAGLGLTGSSEFFQIQWNPVDCDQDENELKVKDANEQDENKLKAKDTNEQGENELKVLETK